MKRLLTCFHAIAPSVKSEKLDVSCFDDARMHAAHDEAKIASREDFENAFSLNNQKYETDDHFQWEGMLTMRASANKLIGALVTTSGNVSYGILADAAHKIYYLVDAQNGFQKKDSMSELFVPGEKFTAYFLVQAQAKPEPNEVSVTPATPAKQAKEEPKTPVSTPVEPEVVTTPVAPAAQVPQVPQAPKKAGPGGRGAKKRTEAPTEKPDTAPEPEAKKEKV